MTTLWIVVLFALMIAAPCLVAGLNSRNNDEAEELEIAHPPPRRSAIVQRGSVSRPNPVSRRTAVPAPNAAHQPDRMPAPSPRPEPFAATPVLTLQELAAKAESDALIAREIARQAHWEALNAVARAAALRADAAEEEARVAGQEAQNAILAAEMGLGRDYLLDSHSPLDLSRTRANRRRAA